MSEWQTIESAPKDGTWILAWRPFEPFGVSQQLVQVLWDPEEEAWAWPDSSPSYGDAERKWLEAQDSFLSRNFTHWMPLPSPPEQINE